MKFGDKNQEPTERDKELKNKESIAKNKSDLKTSVKEKTKEASTLIRQIVFFILGLCGVLIFQEHLSLKNKWLLISMSFGFLTLFIDLFQCYFSYLRIKKLFRKVGEVNPKEITLEEEFLIISTNRARIYKKSRGEFEIKVGALLVSFISITIYIYEFIVSQA